MWKYKHILSHPNDHYFTQSWDISTEVYVYDQVGLILAIISFLPACLWTAYSGIRCEGTNFAATTQLETTIAEN